MHFILIGGLQTDISNCSLFFLFIVNALSNITVASFGFSHFVLTEFAINIILLGNKDSGYHLLYRQFLLSIKKAMWSWSFLIKINFL